MKCCALLCLVLLVSTVAAIPLKGNAKQAAFSQKPSLRQAGPQEPSAPDFAEPGWENNVAVVGDDNAEPFCSVNNVVAFLMYNPNQGSRTDQFIEVFENLAFQTAERVQDKSLVFAKLDVTTNPQTNDIFQVGIGPVFKVMVKGRPMGTYPDDAPVEANEIMKFIRENSKLPLVDIASGELARKLILSEELMFVGFFRDPNHPLAVGYVEAANRLRGKATFAITGAPEVASVFGIQDESIMLLRRDGEPSIEFYEGDQNPDTVNYWAVTHIVPLLVSFDEATQYRAFDIISLHMVLFLDRGDPNYDEYISVAEDIARAFRGQVMVIIMDDAFSDAGKTTMEFLGVEPQEIPLVTMVRPGEGKASAPVVTRADFGTITEERITSWLRKHWKKYLKPLDPRIIDPDDAAAVTHITETIEFEEFIAEHPVVVAYFTDSRLRCAECKAATPVVARVAGELQEVGHFAKIVQIDISLDDQLYHKYNPPKMPYLALFRDGRLIQKIHSPAARTVEGVFSWITDKSGIVARQMYTPQDVHDALLSVQGAVLGVFPNEDTPEAKAFFEAGLIMNNHFLVSTNAAVKEKYNIDDHGILFLKHRDDKSNTLFHEDERVDYKGNYSVDSILDFVSKAMYPLMPELNPDTAHMVFAGVHRNVLVVFTDVKAPTWPETREELRRLANTYRDEVLVTFVDLNLEFAAEAKAHFSVEETPTYRFVEFITPDYLLKYLPTEEDEALVYDQLKAFVDDVREGYIDPYYKSEELPYEWNVDDVKILVGTNHNEIVNDPEKTVFVMYYAPWCEHSVALSQAWLEVGKLYHGKDHIMIARMDVTANEVPGLVVADTPTLKVYMMDDKHPIEYVGPQSMDALRQWITDAAEGRFPMGGKKSAIVHDEL